MPPRIPKLGKFGQMGLYAQTEREREQDEVMATFYEVLEKLGFKSEQ